jgi:Flp pilus assembly protein CpaB
MNKRLLSIIIAAVMALLAVVMINAYLNREKQRYQIEQKEGPVVVSTQFIPKGTTILPKMIKPIKFPVKYRQPGSLNNPNIAVGKIAATDIMVNEQILSTKLTTVRKTQDSLAVRLPQGKRAFTIDITSLMAVGGEIKIGDYIDIIGSFPYTQSVDGKAVTQKVSVTLFQKILVMGIRQGGKGYIFTLALTPQESALLSYAMTQGKDILRFVLRQPLDTAIESVPPIEANALWQYIMSTLGQQLMQAEEQQEIAPGPVQSSRPTQPIERTPTLEIYRGTKKEEIDLRR